MILRAVTLALCLALPAPAARAGVAEEAAAASDNLAAAVAALEQADSAKDRIAALTQTIRAYEQGLAAMRQSMRQAELRKSELDARLEAKRDDVAQLLGVLSGIEAEPGPMLLMHPDGPLGTVRSGMVLSDVTPALQAQANQLRAEITELEALRKLQTSAGDILQRGLTAAQAARSDLSQAMSERTELPKRFTEDPEVLKNLLESADTLNGFAKGLSLDDRQTPEFPNARGTLPLPVLGRVILKPGETDARGVERPGMVLATRPGALVTSPWAGTVRYSGPLLDYGNVIILEPGGGYLLIMAGLAEVYGQVGEVVAQGAALGLMGGADPGVADFLVQAEEGGGVADTETLYLELRQGADPVDPMEWFAATAAGKE
nr:peptidoglycan DD-metalloendopeptidase family protein [Fuscibacter oryzae]